MSPTPRGAALVAEIIVHAATKRSIKKPSPLTPAQLELPALAEVARSVVYKTRMKGMKEQQYRSVDASSTASLFIGFDARPSSTALY
jgi:hypothetical protein